ncbi:hypothetical protein ACX9I7_08785 [Streptomyces sp. L500]|uniref:hypothetical protein n=1 Tax=Streptomyces abikoensis TaxID=97398 RepID=UPI003699DDF5
MAPEYEYSGAMPTPSGHWPTARQIPKEWGKLVQDPFSPPPYPSHPPTSHVPATGERSLLAKIGIAFGCVLAAVLILSGLGVLGVMVLLATGSIQLFPNK